MSKAVRNIYRVEVYFGSAHLEFLAFPEVVEFSILNSVFKLVDREGACHYLPQQSVARVVKTLVRKETL